MRNLAKNMPREDRRAAGRMILETTGGFSSDKRKRRRQHRRAARDLIRGGTIFNPGCAPIGSIPWCVAQWHRQQARTYGR